jgi:hypothetical protein
MSARIARLPRRAGGAWGRTARGLLLGERVEEEHERRPHHRGRGAQQIQYCAGGALSAVPWRRHDKTHRMFPRQIRHPQLRGRVRRGVLHERGAQRSPLRGIASRSNHR